MIRRTRPISWIKAARKEFDNFPEGARSICLAALTMAAEGGKSDLAKPMMGFGSGVFEIALPFRGNAFRVVYAVQTMICGLFMRFRKNQHRELRRQNMRLTSSEIV
jgi:phage-related protein